jgi:hypothetical protein
MFALLQNMGISFRIVLLHKFIPIKERKRKFATFGLNYCAIQNTFIDGENR